MVGASLRTVGAWERGETMPDAEQVWNCAIALGCTPNDVLGWDEIKASAQDPNEAELVRNYRDCTPDRKRSLLTQSSDAASASRGCAERDAAVDGMSA